jgi:hypothetical protein
MIGIDLFHVQAVVADSKSKPKETKYTCNERNASKCAAYGRCDGGAAFRYFSGMRWLRHA